MHKFEVEIVETSARTVEVMANSKDEAIDKAEEMHRKEEVVLNSSDYAGVNFDVIGDLCPTCEFPLVSKMFDVDGTNLEEHSVCPGCGYGTPALR